MAVRDSRTATALATVRRRLTAATTARWARAIASRVAAVVSHSRLAETAARGQQVCRASWLYRWLTAEPDPEVVVIDLRETRIVGPIIAVLDIVLGLLADGWRQARSGRLFVRATAALRARPIQIASGVALVAAVANLCIAVALTTATTSAIGGTLIVAALALAGTRVTVSWETLADSRSAAVVIALLEPPEPPEAPRDTADRNAGIEAERREE